MCHACVASCQCQEPVGHYPQTPHRCHSWCGGAWWGREGFNTFEIVSWPRAGWTLGFDQNEA